MRPRRRPARPSSDTAPTEVVPPEVVEEEVPAVVQEEEYIPPRRPPLPQLWPWLLALLLLVVGGLVAWFLLSRDSNDHKRTTTPVVASTVAVPRVIGLQEGTAVQRLAKKGLVPKPIFRASKFAPGTVFGQTPPERAKVARRSAVTLLVSSGTPNVAVPNVTGLRTAAAVARLKAAGLKSTVTKAPSTQPQGIVLRQQPSVGARVSKGQTVTLTVSSGKTKMAVPGVVGQLQADAEAAVRGAGLVPTTAQVDSTQPAGIVVTQSPPAGTKVAKGAKVRLDISKGPPPTSPPVPTNPPPGKQVKVPNVVGEDQTTAQKRLQRNGLKSSVSYIASSKPVGTVVSEQPPAGTTVKRGSRVALNVSNGANPKPLKAVPDVTGQDQGTATATLRQAGFVVVTIDEPTTDQSQNGIVIDEQPTPGSRIPEGSQVTIYVGVFG
jgi:beta-lactam-binding protein with PASTA domain